MDAFIYMHAFLSDASNEVINGNAFLEFGSLSLKSNEIHFWVIEQ